MKELQPRKESQKPSNFRELTKEVYHIWITERPTIPAAALAYYGIFSFVPILYIIITIAEIFLQQLSPLEDLLLGVEEILGQEVVESLEQALESMETTTTTGGVIASIISFIVILYSASIIFFQLKYILNTIWEVPPPSEGETTSFIKDRLFALLVVIGLGLILILATVANVLVTLLVSMIDLDLIVTLATILIYIGIIGLTVSLLYKFLPDVKIRYRDVLPGSMLTALLMAIATVLLSFYLSIADLSSAFAAAGALAVILISFYFLAQIFLFGAIFIRVYSELFGSKIVPKHQG
jgi:membrane protein